MGSGERSGKFLSLDEQGDDSSYRCTKKSMLHRQLKFPSSGTEISSFGDGGNGTSAASAGGPVFVNSTGGVIYGYDAYAPLTGGSIGSEKAVVFTASQRQEFERQTLIYKYMMAWMPVPPQLLIPSPKAQSNKSALDLKFSAGSDPESWRCRRTDGKKWRCSRDVLPDQKYCERHAHKNRPRSRKPVEIQSQKNRNQNYPMPNFQFPVTASFDQNRCLEWFARGGNTGPTPVSTCNQQKQQLILSPPSTLGFSIGNAMNINTSLYRPELNRNEQEFVSLNTYVDGGVGQEVRSHQLSDSFLHHNMTSVQGSLNANAETIQPTQHFIDAQSAGEKDGLNNSSLSCKSSLFSDTKVPFSSFTLSMPGGSGSDEDNIHHGLSIGMLNPESWSSTSMPGGPLGEALCLGTASNLPSPHGCSNSSGTSSCSFL